METYLAYYHLRHGNHDTCLQLCDTLLQASPLNQALWLVKARALTAKADFGEEDWEQENLADALLENHRVAATARPGTSLQDTKKRPGTKAGDRPVSQAGRPLTGFIRPGNVAITRGKTGKDLSRGFTATLRGGTATARPVTGVSGALVRLNTMSLMAGNAQAEFVNLQQLDLNKYAKHPILSKALYEYIYFVTMNTRKAMDLAALALAACSRDASWWWNAQLGKCYCRLGLFRDAELHLQKALDELKVLWIVGELGKVQMKRDQPKAVIQTYNKYLHTYPQSITLLTGLARIHEALGDLKESSRIYKQILEQDSANVEALSSIASHCYYTDQPEVSVVIYRRLLQMGMDAAETWANVGLSCYASQQFDITLKAFDRALRMSSDENTAEIWYNIGHVALGNGEMALSYQAWKLALVADSTHAESHCNLGMMELKKGRFEIARACFQSAMKHGPNLYEPHFNMALLSYRQGDLAAAYTACQKSLEIFPQHRDSRILLQTMNDIYIRP